MRFPFALAGGLSLTAWLTSALPIVKANLVYQDDGSIGGLAVRPNGQVLMVRTDVPELWSLDPEKQTGTKVLSIPQALGLTAIAEVSPDVFAVTAGNFSLADGTHKAVSWAIWTVDFNTDDGGAPPKAAFVMRVPESRSFPGVTRLDDKNILISESDLGVVVRMNLATGEYGVVISDDTMQRRGGPAGVRGLRLIDGYLYYTNTGGGGLWKMMVDSSGRSSGQATLVSDLNRPEDFVSASDGAFYVSRESGGIARVTAGGDASEFIGAESPTSLALGRGRKDRNVVYFSDRKGGISSAAIVSTYQKEL